MDTETDENTPRAMQPRSTAIPRLKKLLQRCFASQQTRSKVYNASNGFDEIARLLDGFQEDPQLLDPHLSFILPPLASSYLETVRDKDFLNDGSDTRDLANINGKIICRFCKVRGKKVVSRFLDNQPRCIEPLLQAYEALAAHDHSKKLVHDLDLHSADRALDSNNDARVESLYWEQQFVILLWLDHLMFTPFNMSSISSRTIRETSTRNFVLPIPLPDLTSRSFMAGMSSLSSPTRKQNAAAGLLVRLVVRPDTRLLGMLSSTVSWCLSTLKDQRNVADTSLTIGVLNVLDGLLTSGDVRDTIREMPRIYSTIVDLFQSEIHVANAIKSSAVARRLAIKIQRNITARLLRPHAGLGPGLQEIQENMLDQMNVLEDVIDYFLNALAHRDTQVRLAASKALSIITLELQPDMADEVVEAVLGSLNEDVLADESGKNTQSVNPTKWHGLMMTLARLIFHKSPSTSRLPHILGALYSGLVFEQRSPTGYAIGGNVRDAANFGLWSLARRYKTQELEKVVVSADTPMRLRLEGSSSLQKTAEALVNAACLDSVGNVRRGSSAALQELIGRHPDTVCNGIALVQTVDYHAVGLRSRAMSEVSLNAAKLDNRYRDSLLQDLYGSRGLAAPDEDSRTFAASAVGRLSALLACDERIILIRDTKQSLERMPRREVEQRHGMLLALTALYEQMPVELAVTKAVVSADEFGETRALRRPWSSNQTVLFVEPKDLTAARRPTFTSSGIVQLFTALAVWSSRMRDTGETSVQEIEKPSSLTLEILTLCLKHLGEKKLVEGGKACRAVCQLVDINAVHNLAIAWERELKKASRVSRVPGLQIGLGSVWFGFFNHKNDKKYAAAGSRVLDTLASNANPSVEIEARVIAIRSLQHILRDVLDGQQGDQDRVSVINTILETLILNLNDYTINERGDVGSLVRVEAISALETLYTSNFEAVDSLEAQACYWATVRLSLEKLDKIRMVAAHCLWAGKRYPDALPEPKGLFDVSTFAYFHSMLHQHMTIAAGEANNQIGLQSVFSGISSSAGAGSDDIMQTSRSALTDVLSSKPTIFHQENRQNDTIDLLKSINAFQTLLTAALSSIPNDRTLTPLLHTLAYLFDANLLQELPSTRFKYRSLLSLVQKSHHRTSSLPRIFAALDVYRGLAEVDSVKDDVLVKLVSMMRSHPFVKVRKAAAEVAWVGSGWDGLRGYIGDGDRGGDAEILYGFEGEFVGR